MSFQFGTPPDPDKDGIMECHHYRRAVDDYERDGALQDSPMLKHWFVLNACDVILGEDAMYKYSPRELFEKLQELSTSAEEWENLQDMRTSADANYEEDAREDYWRMCDV